MSKDEDVIIIDSSDEEEESGAQEDMEQGEEEGFPVEDMDEEEEEEIRPEDEPGVQGSSFEEEWMNKIVLSTWNETYKFEENQSYCFDIAAGSSKEVNSQTYEYRSLVVSVEEGKAYVMFIRPGDNVIFTCLPNSTSIRHFENPAFIKLHVIGNRWSKVYKTKRGEDLNFIVPPGITLLVVFEEDNYINPRLGNTTRGEERLQLHCGQYIERNLEENYPIRIIADQLQEQNITDLVPGKVHILTEGQLTELDESYSHIIERHSFYALLGQTYNIKVFPDDQKIVVSQKSANESKNYVVNVSPNYKYLIHALVNETYYIAGIRSENPQLGTGEAEVCVKGCLSERHELVVSVSDLFTLIVPPKHSFLLTPENVFPEATNRRILIDTGNDYYLILEPNFRYEVSGTDKPLSRGSEVLNPGRLHLIIPSEQLLQLLQADIPPVIEKTTRTTIAADYQEPGTSGYVPFKKEETLRHPKAAKRKLREDSDSDSEETKKTPKSILRDKSTKRVPRRVTFAEEPEVFPISPPQYRARKIRRYPKEMSYSKKVPEEAMEGQTKKITDYRERTQKKLQEMRQAEQEEQKEEEEKKEGRK